LLKRAKSRDTLQPGRMELPVTSLEDFERKTRDQLARILGPGGFEPAEDIQAITIDRWPHGTGMNTARFLIRTGRKQSARYVVGRKKFGRIAIADNDSGATAYTDVAIDQAYRAVQELVTI
jgi:spermidine dehydrogenase